MAPNDEPPGMKRRTEKQEGEAGKSKSYIWLAFAKTDIDEEHYPLTEEYAPLVSDFEDKLEETGGFGVPKIPYFLSDFLPARIWPRIPPVSSEVEADKVEYLELMRSVNAALKHRNSKMNTDLVLVEILSSASEVRGGRWFDYITFKARDSFGVVRTYETLMKLFVNNKEEWVELEIFRVKPYSPVE